MSRMTDEEILNAIDANESVEEVDSFIFGITDMRVISIEARRRAFADCIKAVRDLKRYGCQDMDHVIGEIQRKAKEE